ncbi:hypothetical protein N1F78_01020 [Seonamhaeicola sp. MEBiC1930]|uniref:hypothetical protein n=1 Tax=Seonamhaeicola sp. MEBiC01930 TaxID=2976768 RepID=UPI0032466F68
MKKFKEYFIDLIYPFVLIILLGILFSIIIYFFIDIFVGYDIFNEPIKEKRLDGTLKIIGTAISITGFISIIVAIIYSKKSIQRDIQKGTIELFQEFNDERFKEIRTKAWVVKEKWEKKKNYRKKFIDHNFHNPKQKKDEELEEEINVIYKLLEFYLVISTFEENKTILQSLRYFYYGWWRPFLYDISSEIESNRKINEIIKTSKSDYLDNISYTQSLERLDRICGLEKIPKNTIIHFDGG